MKNKGFIKFFLIFLFIFTLILMPIVKSVSKINLFSEDPSDPLGVDVGDSPGVFVAQSGGFFSEFDDVDRLNMLVLGVNNNMTDTMMLVSWDMKHDRIDIISVPRDTYYHRTGYDGTTQKKINAIYASQGIKEVAEAVHDVLFGIEINYYAVIDYKAVRNIVNGVGGVPLDVKQDMHYEDPYDTPPLVIDIKKGKQTLDGDHAVQYLRYRHGYRNGDLGRVQAQQEFLVSLYRQCLNHGITSSARLVTKNVKSDLTVGAAGKYAMSAMGLDKDSIHSWTIPGEAQYIDKISFYIQDKDGTKDMLRRIYENKEASASGSDSETSSSSEDEEYEEYEEEDSEL